MIAVRCTIFSYLPGSAGEQPARNTQPETPCASAPALSRFKPRLKPEGVHLSFSPIQLCGGEFGLKVRKNSQLLRREFCIGEPPNYIIDDVLNPPIRAKEFPCFTETSRHNTKRFWILTEGASLWDFLGCVRALESAERCQSIRPRFQSYRRCAVAEHCLLQL